METKGMEKIEEQTRTFEDKGERETVVSAGEVTSKPEVSFSIEDEIKRRWETVLQERKIGTKEEAKPNFSKEAPQKSVSEQEIINIESKFKLSNAEEQQSKAASLEEALEEAKRG